MIRLAVSLVYYTGGPQPEEGLSRIVEAYREALHRGAMGFNSPVQFTARAPRVDRPIYIFLVTHKGQYFGEVSLFNVDQYSKTAEIGFLTTSDCHPVWIGRAIISVLRFAFEELGLNRVEAWVRSSNGRVVTLTKKFGFKKEGVSRSCVRTVNGKFEDAVLFGLLREEFEERWVRNGSRPRFRIDLGWDNPPGGRPAAEGVQEAIAGY